MEAQASAHAVTDAASTTATKSVLLCIICTTDTGENPTAEKEALLSTSRSPEAVISSTVDALLS